jgi:cyanophycin synthetase
LSQRGFIRAHTRTTIPAWPNIHAESPCLLSVLDLGDLYGVSTRDLPHFTEALLKLLPSLADYLVPTGQPGGFAQRLREGTYLARVVEHVGLGLQCLAGAPAAFGRTRPVGGKPGPVPRRVLVSARERGAAGLRAGGRHRRCAGPRQALRSRTRPAGTARTGARYAIGTSTAAVLAAAQERGIPVQRITEDANLFQLGWGARQKRIQATVTGETSTIAVRIASDKQLTKQLLQEAGVPVPRGRNRYQHRRRPARGAQAERAGHPQAARRQPGQGRHRRLPQRSEEVEQAYAFARKHGRRIIVERFVEGARLPRAGGRRQGGGGVLPPSGPRDRRRRHSIRELVDIENRNPARGAGHSNILTKIALDAHAEDMLRKQGYAPDSVPPAGTLVDLRGNANLSTGGTAEDVTDLLPKSTRDLCVRAAAKIGLDVAGIDIVCRDIALPLDEQGGAVIEVNAAPGIRMHQYPSSGEPRDAGDAIIDGLMGRRRPHPDHRPDRHQRQDHHHAADGPHGAPGRPRHRRHHHARRLHRRQAGGEGRLHRLLVGAHRAGLARRRIRRAGNGARRHPQARPGFRPLRRRHRAERGAGPPGAWTASTPSKTWPRSRPWCRCRLRAQWC